MIGFNRGDNMNWDYVCLIVLLVGIVIGCVIGGIANLFHGPIDCAMCVCKAVAGAP